ncbi:MAG: hypothetical protein RL145_841 [Pseudomonadota bacterium]
MGRSPFVGNEFNILWARIVVDEYGATGTADIKAEYIWLMPEVGATGPNGGDDDLGAYMPLATAGGQAGTLNWLHTHHHGAPILTTYATGLIVPLEAQLGKDGIMSDHLIVAIDRQPCATMEL